MTRSHHYISAKLRSRVSRQAGFRCGYCLVGEELMGTALTIDHIVPVAAGGKTDEDNLWLACRRCNGYKGVQVAGDDPATGQAVPLFNPRSQVWQEHFGWSRDGLEIIGKTPCGRATVVALRLNNPHIVVTRSLWVSAGWWPPQN